MEAGVTQLAYRGTVSDGRDNWAKRARTRAAVGLRVGSMWARKRAVLVRAHLVDHAYSWLAMGFVDAAAYVHSVFSGLLVTGILFLLFELKIGD